MLTRKFWIDWLRLHTWGEAETAPSLDIKSWFNDVGLTQVTPFEAHRLFFLTTLSSYRQNFKGTNISKYNLKVYFLYKICTSTELGKHLLCCIVSSENRTLVKYIHIFKINLPLKYAYINVHKQILIHESQVCDSMSFYKMNTTVYQTQVKNRNFSCPPETTSSSILDTTFTLPSNTQISFAFFELYLNLQHVLLCVCFCSTCLWESSILLHVKIVRSFLLLNNIQLFDYITIYLFVLNLVVFCLELSWRVLLQTFLYLSFGGHIHSFLLRIYLGAGCLVIVYVYVQLYHTCWTVFWMVLLPWAWTQDNDAHYHHWYSTFYSQSNNWEKLRKGIMNVRMKQSWYYCS